MTPTEAWAKKARQRLIDRYKGRIPGMPLSVADAKIYQAMIDKALAERKYD